MIENIIKKIRDIQIKNKSSIIIIGIDGGGGSGKTTLATKIASTIQNAQIVHMDDFYKKKEHREIASLSNAPSGYEYDIDRLIKQIILPILFNKTAYYQKYDWDKDCLGDCEEIKTPSILLIEGCYATINQLRHYYQLNIFVDCDKNLRLKRGLERDGESALHFWINWMAGEDKYFVEQKIKERADFVLNGAFKLSI